MIPSANSDVLKQHIRSSNATKNKTNLVASSERCLQNATLRAALRQSNAAKQGPSYDIKM